MMAVRAVQALSGALASLPVPTALIMLGTLREWHPDVNLLEPGPRIGAKAAEATPAALSTFRILSYRSERRIDTHRLR